MPTITALEAQRRTGRVNVFVDGVFTVGVHSSVAEEHRLRLGISVNSELLKAATISEERRKALSVAIKLLESRPRSRQEIESRLTRHGYCPEVTEAVLGQLASANLVDDPAFAGQWVQERSKARQPVGRIRLRQELILKGVDRTVVDDALVTVDDEAEAFNALQAARRHLKPYSGRTGWIAQRHRLIGYLQRRGYNWSIIYPILKELLPPLDEIDSLDCEDVGDVEEF